MHPLQLFTMISDDIIVYIMVAKATELMIGEEAPVPAFVPEIMLLPEIVRVPVPAVIVVIPVYMKLQFLCRTSGYDIAC